MTTISELDARRLLKPHEKMIFRVVSNSWKEWMSLPPEKRHSLSRPTPRANLMAAFMYAEMLSYQGTKGVALIEQFNTVQFLLDNKLLVRFKKLDSGGATRNYPTQRSLAYDAQLPLDGIPSVARIDAGYVLNALGTEISVSLSHKTRKTVCWCYEIRRSDSSGRILTFPAKEIAPHAKRTSTLTSRRDTNETRERARHDRAGSSEIQPPDDDPGP